MYPTSGCSLSNLYYFCACAKRSYPDNKNVGADMRNNSLKPIELLYKKVDLQH